MRVRVRFRYRADTGEVEVFQVEDLHEGPPLADHDARHDRATADVAAVVSANPLIEELPPGTEVTAAAVEEETQDTEPERRPDRLRDAQ